MATISEGERVRVVTREATDDDAKGNVYFGFYGGLTGIVSKIYSPTEVSVEVEQDSLTKEVRRRHDDVRDQMKTKWLDGLSEEGRSKLTERERDFRLRFMILVRMDDLETAGPKPVAAARVVPAAAQPALPAFDEPIEPARKTLAELEAAEELELRKRQGGS